MLLNAALQRHHRGGHGHRARWLWRTLHAAELAGRDPGQVLRDAVAELTLTGARDVAVLIYARIRQRAAGLVQVPALPLTRPAAARADPQRQQFLAALAAAMDEPLTATSDGLPGFGQPAPAPSPKAAELAALRETFARSLAERQLPPAAAGHSPPRCCPAS